MFVSAAPPQQAKFGCVYIGVAERSGSSSGWRDYGFINYRAVQSSQGGERLYGSFYVAGDTVGVLLNMDEGTIAFVKDAELFGEVRAPRRRRHPERCVDSMID